MTWHDLLFAHWAVEPDSLSRLLPRGLQLDLHDGRAYLGIVPFRMTGVRHRLLPSIPWLHAFPELNVRTYIRGTGMDGQPVRGVWFFSLDATSRPAIATARTLFGLNYIRASMRCRADGDGINYDSRRASGSTEFRARYRPTGPAFAAAPGSLEDFLTSRYSLFASHPRRGLLRCEIDHAPWPLQPAEATIDANTMSAAHGIPLPPTPPLLHFVRRLDVIAWSPEAVAPLGL